MVIFRLIPKFMYDLPPGLDKGLCIGLWLVLWFWTFIAAVIVWCVG